MVERFNGRLEQVLQTHRFNSAEDLSKTLHRYVWLYNQHLPQKALNHQTPLMALKQWRESHPHLFKKRVIKHPGPDSPARVPACSWAWTTPGSRGRDGRSACVFGTRIDTHFSPG